MAIITFENGKSVKFEGTPTPEDVGFVAKQLGITSSKETQPTGETGLKGFATGVGQSVLKAVKGAGQLGETIGRGVLGGVEKVTGLPVTPQETYSEPALQQNAQQGGFISRLLNKENLTAQNTSQKIGQFTGDVAQFAIPATKVSKLTQGASLLGKIIPRAITSGTVASIQSGKVGKEAGIVAGVETALPIVGKALTPIKNIVGRLFKGLGSGLSGVGTDTIDKIIQNPKVASETVKNLTKGGNAEILKKNAETIINGVSTIKKEARKAYGEGVALLKAEDIKPNVFRKGIQNLFDKYGFSTSKIGKQVSRDISNVEFKDVKNLKKANSIANMLTNTELNGLSLNKTLQRIDDLKYPSPKTEEGLAFNAFANDISSSVKQILNQSTDKLGKINKVYSTDIGLAQSIENIFGKVKFKNPSELNKVAQQLETLFSKGALSPDYIDKFLTRIGVSSGDFKTTEAVRQITNKAIKGVNAPGLSFGEIMQGVTGAVVTPKIVRDVAIITGSTKPVVKNVLRNMLPTARSIFIKSLIPRNK
jgi:hypothetical protein